MFADFSSNVKGGDGCALTLARLPATDQQDILQRLQERSAPGSWTDLLEPVRTRLFHRVVYEEFYGTPEAPPLWLVPNLDEPVFDDTPPAAPPAPDATSEADPAADPAKDTEANDAWSGLAEDRSLYQLLAQAIKVPGLARLVRTQVDRYDLSRRLVSTGQKQLLDIAASQVEQYGPSIMQAADWPQRLKAAIEVSLESGRFGFAGKQWPKIEPLLELAFGDAAVSGTLDEGRELLTGVLRQGLMDRARDTLTSQLYDHDGKVHVLNRAVQHLQDLQVKGAGDGFTAQAETLTAFLGRPKVQDYLVEDVLAAKQMAVIGGPEKGQKSNIAIDLAISLATGTDFLCHFKVPRPVRTLVITGETCETPLEYLARRILKARMLEEVGENLLIKQELPSLANSADLEIIVQLIRKYEIEVVIFDPVYLMLADTGAKGKPLDTNHLPTVGRLVATAGKKCIDAGATPIFCHHMSKTSQLLRAQEREPMQLSDLTGAGFGPVCRQWLLVNYLRPYDPITGTCELWLNVGGSGGHGGLYSVAVTEGPYRKDQPLYGRQWHTAVKSGAEAIEAANQAKVSLLEAKKEHLKSAQEQRVLTALRKGPAEGLLQKDIATAAGMNGDTAAVVLARLLDLLHVVRTCQPDDRKDWKRWKLRPAQMPTGADVAACEARLRQGVPWEVIFEPAVANAQPGSNADSTSG
ncbi:MAG: AAA family ATPase [Planctomycetia bacterium]|nr:AAA family ATPase [Planctomycetia bacterium]